MRLVRPDIVRLWVIGGTNNVVRWLELLSAALFTYELTGSGFMVAAVTAARTLPMLIFGAFAGVISEALNRKRILQCGMLLTACSSVTICVLALFGVAQPWQIGVASFLCGTVWSTEMSSRRRMVGDAVPPELLSRAIAVDSLAGATTRMIGPLLGGIVYAGMGLAGAYAVTTLLSLTNFVLAWPIVHSQAARPLSLPGAVRDLLEGVRSAVGIAPVMGVLGITVAMNCFVFCYSAMVAPIALTLFGVPNAQVGFLGAAESAGALVAGIMLARGSPPMSPRAFMVAGSVLFAATLMLMPFVSDFWLACLVLVIGGTGTAAFSNMQTLVVMNGAPPAMRSRLLGLITVCIGTGPLGQLLIGALADRYGVLPAVEMMAGTGALVILAISLAWRGAERRPSPALAE
jgi:MFS family permease